MTPTRKNQPGPPPPGNHYKCYECSGQPVHQDIGLQDQFGQRTATVLIPQFLCNPVSKRLADGTVFPIVNPDQHYVCYAIDPFLRDWFPYVTDQFIQDWPIHLTQDAFVCVPSFKHEPTPTIPNTRGRMKTLYR